METTAKQARARRLKLSVVQRFAGDHAGVAAIEFAFIVPILICLYFGSMEIGQVIETNKKVGRISSMVGDLVARESSVDAGKLRSIMQIGAAILTPYQRFEPVIKITGISISDTDPPIPTEVWWRMLKKDGTTAGAKPTGPTNIPSPDVPTKIIARKSFLIRVETTIDYKLVIAWTEKGASQFGLGAYFNGIRMSEIYYMRPRQTDAIGCGDCDAAG